MRLRERVDVLVELGLRGEAVGDFTWDVSDWDDPGSTWSGVEPTFVALDGWNVERVTTRRGRQAGNRRHPAGTAEVQLVYRTPVDHWSFGPGAPVQLGQELRVRVQPRSLDGSSLGVLLPIYRGAVRDIRDVWTPDRADPSKQRFSIVVQLTDRFADVAAVDLPEQALAGLGDLTGQRVARILELANVPAYYQTGDAGVVEHQSSNFARNLLDEMQVTAESETGDLYVDRAGFIVVRERQPGGAHAREDNVQLSWSNTGAPGYIAPSAFGTGQNLDDVVNRVTMARAGSTAYQAPDPGAEPTDSQLRYGLRTYQRFDLTCRYDADVEYAADYYLEQQNVRTQRVEQLQANVDPGMADAQLVQLLDIELRDKHLVQWTDGSRTLEGTLHVQGIAHSITGASWQVSVSLWGYADEGLELAAARWDSGHWSVGAWG